MQSRYQHLNLKAVAMRKKGVSLRNVEIELGIPKSTLSGWFKLLQLTPMQKRTLHIRWKGALSKARAGAKKWHNAQKANRLQKAKEEALAFLKAVGHNNEMIELALALLYLGEGAKHSDNTSIGNSDPRILRFFIVSLNSLYGVPISDIRCELHLRADQSPSRMITYWSKALKITKSQIMSVSVDKRTVGRPTYPNYKGVCVVRCGRVAIVRKLLYIAHGFCDRVIAEHKSKGA